MERSDNRSGAGKTVESGKQGLELNTINGSPGVSDGNKLGNQDSFRNSSAGHGEKASGSYECR